MKSFISIILTLSLKTSLTLAAQYNCKSVSGRKFAELIIEGTQINWREQNTSVSSSGIFLARKQAPYSAMLDYSLFHLNDFYTTEGSRFILAVSPQILNNQDSGKLYIYFDNDGYAEEPTPYNCLIQDVE